MGLKLALTYNLIHEERLINKPIDTMAEFDTEETIHGIRRALESRGHQVICIEADETAGAQLLAHRGEIDLVFNLAEGLRGEARESYIPCLLDTLGIPYVGSGPVTLAIALNKYRAKQLFAFYGIPTPAFQVFRAPDEPLDPALRFPLIAKLAAEGSSIGLDYDSVVSSEDALRRKMRFLFENYGETVLVEEFIAGREFTIPLIGNPPQVMPIIEVLFFGEVPINVFLPDVELDLFKKRHYTPPLRKTRPVCPAPLDSALQTRLENLALKVFTAFECKDWCRLEVRMNAAGELFVLELNPIAGIAPDTWFALSGQAFGLDYAALLNRILEEGARRHGLMPAQG